ncbi:hypothetical protein [Consotaella aegiceratis]
MKNWEALEKASGSWLAKNSLLQDWAVLGLINLQIALAWLA